jgi:hypothetical protein
VQNPRVVEDFRAGPQPTWRNVFVMDVEPPPLIATPYAVAYRREYLLRSRAPES